MKFHDLAIGQRFELEGEIYLKTSPVLAGKINGGASRFIARYVMVRPTDDAGPRVEASRDRLLREKVVLAAFEVAHVDFRQALEQMKDELSADKLEWLHQVLEEGRKGFLDAMAAEEAGKDAAGEMKKKS